MYSKRIRDFFESSGIRLGDILHAKSAAIDVEGRLMPNTEANSDDSLIIKMENGYNIGLRFSDVKLKRVSSAGKPSARPKYRAGKSGSLPKISLFYTGGTIGSKVDYTTGGVHMLTTPEDLLYEVPELSGIANIDVEDLFSIPSEDMTYIEWQSMAKSIAKSLNGDSVGAVVSMGTDTMHYASAALSFMLDGLNSPVMFTGAQRSSDRGSSDAFMNLICSSHAAASSDIAEVGICMHATSSDDYCHVLRGTKARKMHTSRRDAFRPINSRPIAEVHPDGKIAYKSEYKRRAGGNGKVVPTTGFEEGVAIVSARPNSDPSIMDFFAGKGYKGIIIEGTGLGHTPVSTKHKGFSWLEAVKSAAESGIIVGITSQCLYGRVNSNVYSNLRRLSNVGAIPCEDMLPETAYVKLGWLLGNYSKEDSARLLPVNMRGEINDRTKYDTFLV